MFKTFLEGNEPFETYGYSGGNFDQFDRVKDGDEVLCYQFDKKMIVGRCEVVAKECNSVGGLCLVLKLRAKTELRKRFKQKGTIFELSKSDLSEEEAEAIAKD